MPALYGAQLFKDSVIYHDYSKFDKFSKFFQKLCENFQM